MSILRVVWPVLDLSVSAAQIIREVREDLPAIATAAGAQITGSPRFRIADAASTPGHPRVSRWVLVCEAPAVAAELRPYRRTG